MTPDRLTTLIRDVEVDIRTGADVGGRLSASCVEVLEVSGAGIMLMSDGQHYGTLGMSDDVIGVVEDLQFTTGEGPCVDAYRSARPIHEPDLREPVTPRWPAFSGPAVEAGVRAIFGFPLGAGTNGLGALDLYLDQPGSLDTAQVRDALILADVISGAILSMQLEGFEGTAPPSIDHRAVVHQASGMVSIQLGIGVDDALVRIRARAYTEGRSVKDVANDIVERRLRLS